MSSPLQKIAMGMVIVVGTAYFPAEPVAPWAAVRRPARPAGLAAGAPRRLRPGPGRRRASTPAAGWRCARRRGERADVAPAAAAPASTPPASGSPRCPQVRSAWSCAREIGLRGATQIPPGRLRREAVRPAGVGIRRGRRTPGAGHRRRAHPARGDHVLFSTLVNVAFVYFLFRVHRREWLGGPGSAGDPPARRRAGEARRPPTLELRGTAFACLCCGVRRRRR